MDKVYIDICDNFKLFLRFHEKKLDNNIFKRWILLLQFNFLCKLNIVTEKTYRRNRLIIIHLNEKTTIRKFYKKVNKILVKEEKNKIILSKRLTELVQESKYYRIQECIKSKVEDKNDFHKEITTILEDILYGNNFNIEETNVYILCNQYSDKQKDMIMYFAQRCKSANIVTKGISDYVNLERDIYENFGSYITVTNNKRKSLANAKVIINIDFSENDLEEYSICRNALIFNLSEFKILKIRGFEGTIINNVIMEETDRSFARIIERRFAEIYDNNFKIIKLIGNNGSVEKIY